MLVMSVSDPRNDPRPNWMIDFLKEEYDVTVVGTSISGDERAIEGTHCIIIKKQMFDPAPAGKMARKLNSMLHARELWRLAKIRAGMKEHVAWRDLHRFHHLLHDLPWDSFDLIISHDLVLLPLIFRANRNAPVFFDAREFYPRNFEDQFRWRLLCGPINHYLCRKYLQKCAKIITVCQGSAGEYRRAYDVQPEVVMSLPVFRDLEPVKRGDGAIRVVHHGYASASRRIEDMIQMMDYVDERFSLDLMLLQNPTSYLKALMSMGAARGNVRFIPPVAMPEIVPFTNRYDIGLFLCRPTNFNLRYTLPNKFFEFIQARLAIAIGPSVEMRKLVERYDCGVVSGDFSPRTLARALNSLTAEKLHYYKQRAAEAARILNADSNRPRILGMVRNLIGK